MRLAIPASSSSSRTCVFMRAIRKRHAVARQVIAEVAQGVESRAVDVCHPFCVEHEVVRG